MNRRMIGVAVSLALVAIAIVSSPIAFSQMEATPTVYTFVSQFQVPRANWAGYSEDTEKTVVPILEKLTADGTIASWSTFEQVVHTTDGYTHGAAWSSTDLKSTRLNSSHTVISYAVFCLKKKKDGLSDLLRGLRASRLPVAARHVVLRRPVVHHWGRT